MTRLVLSCFVLAVGWQRVDAQAAPMRVPTGAAPVVDGTIAEGEWDDAAQIPLQGGEAVFLKRSGSNLYVAIEGASGGFASVGFGTVDTVRILHASTGLITASYVRDSGSWRLLHGFRSPERRPGERFRRGESKFTDEYRSAQLHQFGWFANVVEAGAPTDMEYQIHIEGTGPGAAFLSVVFFQARARIRVAHAPSTLADASLDRELISGGAHDGLEFEPRSWIELRW
jgi:hypothetical protein